LDLIASDLNAYAARAQQFLRDRAASVRQSMPALDMIAQESAGYILHCRQFDEAQQWALGLFGRESHRTTILLQRLLVFEVALLLSFWSAVAVVLYRTMVAPLRAKLIATRGLMERQEKMASLGTLAAGVAHEIRNPLTAIKVRLHGLTKLLPVGSSEAEDAILIGGEIQRLDRIVRDFLEFGRPSEPEFQTVRVADLLSSVHRLFRGQLHGSAVEMCIDPGPAATLRVDPQQIEQVLINLVRNAAESIAGHGTITVRAFRQRLTLQGRTCPAIVIEVADTGQGIPPDIQKRLFDPFFTTKDGGTGLGLAIAARIVEKHGGILQFQTRLNRGTTFRLALPARNSHES
jgi:signal transduction histidine kinase